MTPAWTWRRSSLDESGQRTIGYRFRVPISIGVTEFLSLDQIGDLTLENIGAISVVPGVEIDIPMTDRWSLKPLAYVGYGSEINGGDNAAIYHIGVRSQYEFQFTETEMLVVNGLESIGYSADTGSTSGINVVKVGLDFSRPLRNRRIRGEPVAIGWHVMYSKYVETVQLDPSRGILDSAGLNYEWELGVSFGQQTGRLQLWRARLDRIGLAYRYGADGDFTGIAIVFKSLFDR